MIWGPLLGEKVCSLTFYDLPYTHWRISNQMTLDFNILKACKEVR